MTIAAHTNEVGAFSLYTVESDRETGQGYGQTRNKYTEYKGMTRAYSSKSAKKSGRTATVWKNPTTYDRVISRIMTDSPVIILDDDGRTHAFTLTRSGQCLSIPYSPADASGIGGRLTNCEDKGINDCLLALRGERNGANGPERPGLQLGADAAEAKKGLAQIAKTSSGVLGAYKELLRGNLGGVMKHLDMSPKSVLNGKYPANKWLEYQYGWKPMLASIADGHQRLREGLRQEYTYFSAKSFGRDSYQERRSFPHLWETHHEGHWSWECRVKTQIYYRVKSSVIDTIDSVGLLNPLSVAWELVPGSFVLDWFIPIGNTLAALTAPAGLEFVAGYQSTTEQRSLTAKVIRNDNASANIKVLSGGNYRWQHFRFNRRVMTGFPAPRLYANLHPFSSSHVGSALALLRQLL